MTGQTDHFYRGTIWFPVFRTFVFGVFAMLPGLLVAQTGTITGNVTNEATGAFLQGVIVAVEGTNIRTTTSRDGSFRLSVPAGSYTLSVSYTGLDSDRRQVNVGLGVTARTDFQLSSPIYELAEFVVASEREGDAAAIMRQRQAINVKNVVSSDAFGSLVGNPADLLVNLPGISGEDVGGDLRYVRIRGIDPQLSSVQIDGNRIASVGADRALEFQNITSDHIESIEVTKAPTPDMDADALGGSVNLRSKSAFDLKERRISYTLGGVLPLPGGDAIRPAFSYSYSGAHSILGGENNLGISFNLSFRQHNSKFAGRVAQWPERTDEAPAYLYRFRVQDGNNIRTRGGAGMKIEYKLSNDSMVFANFTTSPSRDLNRFQVIRFDSRQEVANLDSEGNPFGRGPIMPDYTDDITVVRGMDDGPGRRLTNTNFMNQGVHLDRKAMAYTAQLGGRTDRGIWEVDYDVSYSHGRNDRKNPDVAAQLFGLGWIVERRERWTPDFEITSGPDPSDLANYTGSHTELVFLEGHGLTKTEIYGTQVNYRRNFTLPAPTFIKTGIRLREEKMNRWQNDREWIHSGSLEGLSRFEDLGHRERAPNYFDKYPFFPSLSTDLIRQDIAENPDDWQEDFARNIRINFLRRVALKETVSAAYLLGATQLGRFSLLGGLRTEQTRVQGEGVLNEITPEEADRRAAWVGPLTDEEIIRRTTAEWGGRQHVSRRYTNVFPSVHGKYEPRPGLIFRGSWSTAIGRPRVTTILPDTDVDRVSETVRMNNTGLKPQYSNNFDLSVEYYFEPGGLFSVGVFRKKIEDYIFNVSGITIPEGPDNGFDGRYAGYELRTQANGGSGKVEGLEVNYKQQFTFLPGFWGGFGAYANSTWLDSSGNYGADEAADSMEVEELTGFAPLTANTGISYISGKIDLRVQYTHTSKRFNSFHSIRNLRDWMLQRDVVNIKFQYNYRRNLSFYVDVLNVTNDARRTVWGVFDRPKEITKEVGPKIHFGIRGRL